MTISYGPNLGLMENANDGEGHAADFRKLLRGIDGLVHLRVKDKDLTTPPGSPANGDCYIPAVGATGAWSGHAGKVARYSSVAAAWEFYAPKEGWRAAVEDEDHDYRHDGSAWVIMPDPQLRGYIDGLKMIWVSGTSLSVSSGAAWIEGLGRFLRVPSAITKSSLSLSANTWYHVYLYLNAGSPDIEIATTAPATAYSGTARSKTGDNTRRYIGSVRADGSSSLINFMQTGLKVTYLGDNIAAPPNRVLTGGSATTRTTVDLSPAVPETSKLAFLGLVNLDAGQPFRIDNSETGNTGLTTGLLGIGAGNRLYSDIPCDASQDIIYYYVAAPSGGNAYIDVLGYTFER